MSRTLRIGDQGGDVRAVQDVLNFHIRRLEALDADGKFGSLTKSRVVEFQQANALQPDGIVGNETKKKLFETEELTFSLAILPKLLLNLPKIGTQSPLQQTGLRPPNLIPPLTLPTLTPLRLPPSSFSTIPPLNSAGQTLNLKLTVPARNDPRDPKLSSFLQIVQLLETLPANFPFRTMIIGAVPKPKKKIGSLDLDPVGDLSTGFKWGIDPVFDLKQPTGPSEFTVGAKGNAKYTLGVINQPGPGGLKLGIFAEGDFKGELDYTSQKATSRPLLLLEGSILAGIEGRF